LPLLDFGGATFAFIDCAFCVKVSRALSLQTFGASGTITMSRDDEHRLQLFADDMEKALAGWIEPMMRWLEFKRSHAVKDLLEAMEESREPALSAEHARYVAEIMSKCHVGARQGRAVPPETSSWFAFASALALDRCTPRPQAFWHAG